jgi:hypothetical protein
MRGKSSRSSISMCRRMPQSHSAKRWVASGELAGAGARPRLEHERVEAVVLPGEVLHGVARAVAGAAADDDPGDRGAGLEHGPVEAPRPRPLKPEEEQLGVVAVDEVQPRRPRAGRSERR